MVTQFRIRYICLSLALIILADNGTQEEEVEGGGFEYETDHCQSS